MQGIVYYFKPSTWCLMLHMDFWNPRNIITQYEGDIEVYFCEVCNRLFKYPSKKTDEPVYRR